MWRRINGKLRGCGGLSRAALLLIIPIVILLALILWPQVQKFRFESQRIACNTALDAARDSISIDYIVKSDAFKTPDNARNVVGEVMNRWQGLCDSGGTVYLMETESGEPPYTLICGKHDSDAKLRTRLNSDYALTQLQNALAENEAEDIPTRLTVSFNGKSYPAESVDADPGIRRGTGATGGAKGTVIYFAVMGESDFCEDSLAKPGEICFFLFADEDYCAIWTPDKGWSGDSYS